MNNEKINGLKKTIKTFNILKTVGIIFIPVGAILFIVSIVRYANALIDANSATEQAAALTSYYLLAYPSILLLMAGIALTIVFSILGRKKRDNLYYLEKEEKMKRENN